MESLAMDMGQLNVGGTPASSRTILEALGYDQDTSFDRPISTQIVSDTNHLSIGGRVVSPGENIQVMIRDDNVVLDLHRSGIAGELILPATVDIDNILQILQPIEWILGNVQCGYANMQYYLQQKLYTSKWKQYEKIAKGLLLARPPEIYETGFVRTQRIGFLRSLRKGSFAHGSTGIAKDVPFTANTETVADAHVYQFFLPLSEIFPQLKEFPDGLVYIGLGQQLKMNIRLNAQGECLVSQALSVQNQTEFTYALRKCQLVKVYTKLDAPRADAILRSSFILPKRSYSTYTTPISQNPILVFNVTQKDRVKKLYIGCHFPNQSVSRANESFGTADNGSNFYVKDPAANSFFSVKSPTGFFVEMPIEYIHFNFGGETRVFTLNQLQLLNAGSIIANKHYLQENTL